MLDNKPAQFKVLIIDDDSQIRSYIRSTLALFGQLEIINAVNANEGITKFTKHNPDIVFLDINLPDKDGLTLLKEFLTKNSSANVIMVSGNSTIDNVKTAINSGAKGFVVKPFTMKKILDSVSNIVSAK